jgi:hypothetical protein
MQLAEPKGSPIPSVSSLDVAQMSDRITPIASFPSNSDGRAGKRMASLPAEGQSAAEDATEEIVPWMFDAPEEQQQTPSVRRC